eukprot:Gb_14022 [translate_table: standard]
MVSQNSVNNNLAPPKATLNYVFAGLLCVQIPHKALWQPLQLLQNRALVGLAVKHLCVYVALRIVDREIVVYLTISIRNTWPVHNPSSNFKCGHTSGWYICISMKDYADGGTAKKIKSVNDWLPITSSRNAKWWYSAFHNVTAMVGAGVLSLPYTMVFLGWGPGIVLHVLSWAITLYTLWQLSEMHEIVPGKRFDRYHELGQHALGEKLGLWVVVPLNLMVEVGVDIVYMVTGGKSLKKFHETVCTSCKRLRQSYWILIFSSVHFLLSQLPNLNSVAGVSMAAAVMSLRSSHSPFYVLKFPPLLTTVLSSVSALADDASLSGMQHVLVIGANSYSTIAWGACLYHGQVEDVSYDYIHTTSSNTVFRVFNALGVIAFAYAGHNVCLEIQATIPSTPEKPSKIPMWRGVVAAYFVTAICYIPVALVGYWAFGQRVDDNLLLTLKKPDWLIAAANMMVVIHVIGSYQVYAMPIFDMIETVLVKKLHLPPGFWLRLIARSTYVAFTCFIAITFPFFGDLLGFFGGLAFAPTSYFIFYWQMHRTTLCINLYSILYYSVDEFATDGRGNVTLRYVARYLQAKTIQRIMASQLGQFSTLVQRDSSLH